MKLGSMSDIIELWNLFTNGWMIRIPLFVLWVFSFDKLTGRSLVYLKLLTTRTFKLFFELILHLCFAIVVLWVCFGDLTQIKNGLSLTLIFCFSIFWLMERP